jgi:uncharacterized iron-regulated protein
VRRYFLLLLCFFFFAGCASLPENYVELNTKRVLSLKDVLERIENRRVIFAGELHTDTASHNLQYEIIRYLYSKEKRVVIAFEMFPDSKQSALDRWIDGSVSEKEFTSIYRETVKLPFRYYRKIFEFARSNSIPIIGINGDRVLINNVSMEGPQAASREFLDKIKYSDCSSDDEYAAIYRRQFHDTQMPFLCEGQRLRDSIMAYNISRILRREEITVVVLAGAAHVAEPVLPRLLSNHVDVSYSVLMPEMIRNILDRTPETQFADYFLY